MRLASYRLRNVVAAVLLAVLAMTITLVYVSHARTQGTAPAEPASVFVAARDIPVGTSWVQLVQGGWVRPASVGGKDVVPGAVTALAQLKGLVATQAIYAGEQVTTRRLGVAGRQGLRSGLHGTLRLFELPGDAHQLLAGTLRDGDRVDVVASVPRPETGQTHFARVVLRNLLVVDAPAAVGGSGLTAKADAAVQLQLTDEQAQRLFWVEKSAQWTLVLRPAGDATSTSAGAASAGTVLGGQSGR
ncbi:MAG TPA: Flp pilus assembly protein CpaB [Gaiellaceae bacterium]